MSQPQPRSPQPHRRLLALDPGERRVGVAISDELGMYAHPRGAIGGGPRSVDTIAALVEAESISEVIVGLPLSLSGADSSQTRAARAFAMSLRARLAVPVTEWDERLSSVEAGRIVHGARRRSGDLDSAAASVVLQAVLDFRRGGVGR
jgi:putative Holliday junction resolvase